MCGVELERPSLSYIDHAIVIDTDFRLFFKLPICSFFSLLSFKRETLECFSRRKLRVDINYTRYTSTLCSYDLPRFIRKFKLYINAEIARARKKEQIESEEDYWSRFEMILNCLRRNKEQIKIYLSYLCYIRDLEQIIWIRYYLMDPSAQTYAIDLR